MRTKKESTHVRDLDDTKTGRPSELGQVDEGGWVVGVEGIERDWWAGRTNLTMIDVLNVHEGLHVVPSLKGVVLR
jgi:hypothetical protein